ncbi:MAG TPA: NAD-dependent epimerase/dehydratase family protein, partial [Chloroflexota bacterium]|nr:NAD-dependent epimerase/dehydratase family protein [Chloroflexota bacterium]
MLVTGGAGFIGSHLVDALLRDGHRVRVLDDLRPPVHSGNVPAYLSPEIEFQRGSVVDRAVFLRALTDVDAVFHLAAYQDYLTDFSTFFLTNSVGTAMLYEIIVQERLPIQKVVVASSQAIYGEGKYQCASHGTRYPDPRATEQLAAGRWDVGCPDCGDPMEPQWSDEAVVTPHNSYALSKRDQEDLAVKLGRRYGIPSVALRYSIVQGPRQSFHNAYSGVLRSFAVRVLTGQNPVLFEDGNQLRDYVSVHDVVRANLLALRDERADYRAFNVGGDRRVSVREVAALVASAAGRPVTLDLPGLYRVGDTRHIFSDVTRLGKLGW